MKKNLAKDLIKLADKLDKKGLFDLADEIDLMITNYNNILGVESTWKSQVKRALEETEYEEVDIEVPEEERQMLEDVLKSLTDSLQ